MKTQTKTRSTLSRTGRVVGPEITLWICALTIVIASAIWTKERGSLPALAGVHAVSPMDSAVTPSIKPVALTKQSTTVDSTETETTPEVTVEIVDAEEAGIDTSIRWFDGKAVRPTKVMYMTVTGYSPDARSCGIYADNKTATMNSVWTNGMNLVAADPKLLPYWSMISIPGYANSEIVPVLDCGGAIKGNRLDLLYPTHEIALQWGVRELPITIWEYVETE